MTSRGVAMGKSKRKELQRDTNFQDDGYSLHFDYSGGFTQICQHTRLFTLSMHNLLYVNYTSGKFFKNVTFLLLSQ